MIIKNNNKAVDVLKNQHVCWEGQKTSRRFYVKKTVSYGKWSAHREPETIPAVSWEGGTTAVCKVWFERTNTIREGFDIRTEVEKQYVEPNKSLQNGVTASGNSIDGYSVTFPKRDETSNDLKILFHYMFDVSNDGYTYDNLYAGTKLYIAVEYKQTKRDKYVTKLDNASITTNLIPASGGNISSGTLTFRKTYNTGETENVSEHVTFSTVSATTKGTTESPVTDVKTIPAGGTTQAQTTIDGVTLTHPSFTVKQAANTKTIKTPESKTTTSVILSVNPTVVYSSGGTVTFTLLRKYTLNKVVYLYTSGSTSGGGSDANQGPEAVNANLTYTITGITGVSSTKGTSYKIPASTSARTIKFKTTYDGITSNEASVSLKLDGPNESKAFIYSNLKITEYSYTKDNSGYHFPASGKTITATDCTLKGTYDWTYTSMENKTVTETVTWTFNDLTAAMYTFTPTSFTADSLGTMSKAADILYKNFTVDIKNLKHTYNGKLHDVKDSNGRFLTASKTVTLTRLGNSGTQASNPTSTNLSVSVSPTSFDYKGGSATLTATLIKIFNVTWTSGATSTNPTNTDVTSSTTFSGTYREYGQTQLNTFSFTGNKPTIPNILSSKTSRTYTFTGTYGSYSDTATVSQTGNTTLYTVTFYINNTYAKWSKTTGNESITKKFSKDTPYTELIPDETPTWLEGSNLKYVFLGNYSTTTTGAAVTSGSLLTSDINLYARWSTASTGYVKVSWNPNGGQLSPASGGTSTSNAIYDYHNPGTIRCLPSDIGYKNTPSKTGNTFIGWYYNSTYYTQFPISITLGTTAIQFNAMYTVTEKTVYWNSNGGTFSDGSTLKSEKKNYGASISAYSSSPSKTATTSTIYKFKGWSLTTNGNVVTFPYTLTTTSSTFNFYAIYTSSVNTCIINWNNTNSNIAIWSDNTKGTKTSSANYGTKYSELTAPATLANPIKNDNDTIRYTGAWYTASINGTLLSNSSATVTSNPTNVYLLLTIAGYKVTLNPDNGTLTVSGHTYTSSNPYITYTKGSFNLGNYTPTRTDYSFKGWSTNSSATSGSTSSVTINTAITYYAIWKQIFTVTWNLNGGNINGVTTNKTESVESGSTVSFSKYTPVKTGYTFNGWSTSSAATSGSTTGNSAAITADTTFYAIYTISINTYTVTWANTNDSIAIWKDNTTQNKTSSVTHGTKYNLLTAPAEFANPIKNSGDTIRYTAAWYTLPANGELLSTSTTLVTKDITVYAVLTISGYKVTLNPNNGTLTVSGHTYTSSNPYITYTKGSFNLGNYTPTRSGEYNFKGWSTSSIATSGSTSSVTINAAITYYAIWKQLFTVTWNLQGGNIGGVTTNKTESVESGSTVSFSKYTPVRTGYTFNGWATSSTATSGSTTGNSAAITADTTFYAIYTISINTYTVTWNLQGGNINGDTTNKTESVESGSTVSFTKYTPVKTGYTFNGWATSSTATSGSTTGNSAAITTDTTFYATWKQIFTVTWNLQGGNINGDTTNKTESVESGSTVSFTKYTPVKTGYTFNGWATSSTATSGNTSGSSSPITADTTFYAIYKSSVNTYTVTWANTNDSIAIWKDNTTQNKTSSVTHGTRYNLLTAPAEFANPIKNSGDTIRYTAAWYTLPANGELLSTSTTQVTKDITVYAVLTITSYKVTLNPNNGTLTVSGHAYTSSNPYITYTKGSFNLENYTPIRTGYNFKGWGNAPSGNYVGGSVTINSSITYYALWQQLFTVTWNLNGGNINGDTTNKTESVESGTTVSFTKYTPVKTGYTFNGWATSSTATSGSTTGNSAAITADTTFYATWKSATLTPILLILAE